jgi:hypothetical protein
MRGGSAQVYHQGTTRHCSGLRPGISCDAVLIPGEMMQAAIIE